MNTMDFINDLEKQLSTARKVTPDIVKTINSIDKALIDMFVGAGYYQVQDGDYTAVQVLQNNMRTINSDDTLKMVKKKMENSVLGIDSWLQNAYGAMHSFLQKWHIGYIHNSYIDDAVRLNVEINCAITAPSFQPGTAQQVFWNQIEALQTHGFDVDVRGSITAKLPATGNNFDKLIALFKKNNNIDVRIEAQYGAIDTITINMSLAHANLFKEHVIMPESTFNDYKKMAIKELQSMSWNLGMWEACRSTQDGMSMLVLSNIEYQFDAICTALKTNTVISGIIAARHAEEKAKNESIRKIDTIVASKLTADVVYNTTTQLINNMRRAMVEKLGFNIDSMQILSSSQRHHTCRLRFAQNVALAKSQLRDSTVKLAYDQDNTWEVCRTDDCADDSISREVYLLDTPENKAKLVKTLREMKAEIVNIESKYQQYGWNMFNITYMDINLYDLTIFCNE